VCFYIAVRSTAAHALWEQFSIFSLFYILPCHTQSVFIKACLHNFFLPNNLIFYGNNFRKMNSNQIILGLLSKTVFIFKQRIYFRWRREKMLFETPNMISYKALAVAFLSATLQNFNISLYFVSTTLVLFSIVRMIYGHWMQITRNSKTIAAVELYRTSAIHGSVWRFGWWS